MEKLLNAYRKLPTMGNRIKLQSYLRKHPMAVCLASPDQTEFLKIHDFQI